MQVSKKGFGLVGLLIILGLVVAAGGVYLYVQNKTPGPVTYSTLLKNSPFAASPSKGSVPLTVIFTYRGSAGLSDKEVVDFGDGSTGKLGGDPSYSCPPNAGCTAPAYYVEHVYHSAGVYNAVLSDTGAVLGTVTITVK